MSQREQPSRACKRVKSGKNSDSAIGGDSVGDSGSEYSQGRAGTHLRSSAVSPESLLAPGSSVYLSSCSSSALGSSEETVLGMLNEEEIAHELDGLDHSEDLPPGSGVSGEFGPQSFNTFMTQFSRMVDSMATLTGASAGGQESANRNRQINNLPPHKDGADIAKYLRKLEADLRDIGVPSSRFKSILYQKLQSKSASAIVASIDRDTCSYSELTLSFPNCLDARGKI